MNPLHPSVQEKFTEAELRQKMGDMFSHLENNDCHQWIESAFNELHFTNGSKHTLRDVLEAMRDIADNRQQEWNDAHEAIYGMLAGFTQPTVILHDEEEGE